MRNCRQLLLTTLSPLTSVGIINSIVNLNKWQAQGDSTRGSFLLGTLFCLCNLVEMDPNTSETGFGFSHVTGFPLSSWSGGMNYSKHNRQEEWYRDPPNAKSQPTSTCAPYSSIYFSLPLLLWSRLQSQDIIPWGCDVTMWETFCLTTARKHTKRRRQSLSISF